MRSVCLFIYERKISFNFVCMCNNFIFNVCLGCGYSIAARNAFAAVADQLANEGHPVMVAAVDADECKEVCSFILLFMTKASQQFQNENTEHFMYFILHFNLRFVPDTVKSMGIRVSSTFPKESRKCNTCSSARGKGFTIG